MICRLLAGETRATFPQGHRHWDRQLGVMGLAVTDVDTQVSRHTCSLLLGEDLEVESQSREQSEHLPCQESSVCRVAGPSSAAQ